MPKTFVKLDCKMLHSSLWPDMEARTVFITALLMAEPWDTQVPEPQLTVRTMEDTGWSVPPGWYGFVPAAGVGIVAQSGVAMEPGLDALERLGSPEMCSRSQEYEGRRLVRIDGGYIVLNFYKYRERDTTARERQERWRKRKEEMRRAGISEPTPMNGHAIIPESEPAPPDATKDPRRQWPYERTEWGQQYVAAGCKIGPENWPRWKELAAKHGGHARVISAASTVPATKRWPDETEAILVKSGGQAPSLNDAVAHKTVRLRND